MLNAAAGLRPQRFAARTYAAFRLCDGLGDQPVSLPIDEVTTLDDAVKAALTCGKAIYHKDKLAIRETDQESGEALVHLYAIRQRSARWVHGAGDMTPRRVADLYPEKVCVLRAEVWG